MIMDTTTENNWTEPQKPVSLESLPPLQKVNEGREWEKNKYWNNILTGNPDTVPDAVRQKAGAADENSPAEERNYRLMSNINRSWVVDFKNKKKEEVRATWPDIRLNLSKELGVRDSEPEVYTALSLRQQDAPRQQEVRDLFEKGFSSGLKGEQAALHDADDDPLGVREEAHRLGAAQRAHYLPLAESVSGAWGMMKAEESSPLHWLDMVTGFPDMLKAVDEMADMPPDERARVYEVARTLESTRKLQEMPASLAGNMLHSMRRGTADLRHYMAQGAGHIATSLTKAAAETLESDVLRNGAAAADKRLQVLDELRRVAQGEVFPIDLGEDSSLLESMAVDAAGAVPGAALAFMGGAGFGMLALSGAGAAIADARSRSPQGKQELQTAAGVVGGALQAGIYMGMSRIGANMLNRTIGNFAKARGAGFKGYSLASLGTLGTLTAENIKLLLAGKAAHASELGMQELAARVDKVASNIDWEAYGDNLTDIEANMRESAMNLPFILIAAGRAALHHFRSPRAMLENTRLLEDWGVDEAARTRILNEPDIHVQSDMLRDALRSSKRWGGPGALQDFIRSLKLLNTGGNLDFRDARVARDFLNMEADVTTLMKPEVVERDVKNPAVVKELFARVPGHKMTPSVTSRYIPYLQLWDEWSQLSHGSVPMPPDELIKLNQQYKEILKDKRKGIPKYLRLDGYYHPYREESVQVLAADRTREVLNNSYRLLMNTETLGSLVNSYPNLETARSKTEDTRRMYVSEFCRAMMRCVQGMPAEDSFMMFNERLEQFYLNRRRGARHAPAWLHQESEATIREAKTKAYFKTIHPKKGDSPHIKELYRSLVSARACGESLLELLPHTRDFQTLLSMGFKPEEAYSHLLHREFKEHVDSSIWNPVVLNRKMANASDNITRLEKSKKSFADYLALSGYQMENTTDANGKELHRIMCPDGRYSPWMRGPAHVVNTMVGNVQTSFLPWGHDMLLKNMQGSYKTDVWNKRVFERRRMFPLSMDRFVGFDHLGNTAARDLCALWLSDSTQYGVGLEFSLNDEHWKRYKGKKVNAYTKEIEPETGMYLVRHGQIITPMDLIKSRFSTYWHRMMISGWVSPQEVGQALVAGNMMTQNELDALIREGTDRPVDFSHMSREHRRRFIKKNNGPFVRGNHQKMYRILAERMTNLNVVYMLANLEKAPLPNTVKQWFLTTPFSEFKEPETQAALRHEMAMHANRTAANEVKSHIPRVMSMRESLKQGNHPMLEERMRLAYEPDENRRYEQGWCYSVGGAGAFRSAGQSFWNLLENPARAWKMLPEDQREKLVAEIQDVCGDRPVGQAVQELSDVLKQYPALHGYAVETRGGSELCRMVLDPINLQNLTEPVYLKYVDARYGTPILVKNGFTVEKSASLPEECAADSRVMPAIRLLTELRRQVTDIPFTDQEGIWWKKIRYGGVEGKRPGGLNEQWTPECGLKTMLEYYLQLDDMCRESGKDSLEVCGVKLGGMQLGNVDMNKLRHITVYRCDEFPEHMVRLMPGEADADNPRQRSPYVLHSADGTPLLPTRQARTREEYTQALIPLRDYSGRVKSYDYATNVSRRRNQVESWMYELVSVRGTNVDRWKEGSLAEVDNLELCMQLFQDSRLPYFLASRHPETLTRGEALTCELARLSLLAEVGVYREQHIEELIQFCRRLREDKQELHLIQHVLNRVVSPTPDKYSEEEVSLSNPTDE